MPEVYNNVCPALCPASCRLKTEVENEKIITILGDPDDPYAMGKLCVKGYTLLDCIYSPERILYPMKQIGKGTNFWQRISWEQALTEIAEVMIRIKQEEGHLWPVCLGRYAAGMGVLSRSVEEFFNSIGFITKMVGSLCESAGNDALLLSYGSCQKPWPEDMAESRLIIIWGGNPAVTSPHQMRCVFEAQERGTQVVVIDPIFTATAARSDLYIQINPGTDGDLALGMAKVLMDEGLVDRSFLENYTKGWLEFSSILESVNLEAIALSTGIPVSEIYALARVYGNHKPATIWLGMGGLCTPKGGLNYSLINTLAAISGNIGVPGGNIHYNHLSYDKWDFAGDISNLRVKGVISGENKELFQHRIVGSGCFESLMKLEPGIQLFWVAGHNPLCQVPDLDKVKQALGKIPTVVVVDLCITQTALYADYFLPVATSFEYEDIVISFWHYGAAVNEKAIEPVGESKPDFQIMKELAVKLNSIVPGFCTFPVESEAAEWLDLEMRKFYPLLGIRHYRELSEQYLRVESPPVPWQDKVFLTSSGKFEFPVECGKDQIKHLLKNSSAAQESGAYPLRLITQKSVCLLNSQFRNSPRLKSMEKTSVVMINTDEGCRKNIRTGDKIKLYNQLGEVDFEACLTPSVPPGIVAAFVGGESDGDGLNTLKGSFYHHSHVNICKEP